MRAIKRTVFIIISIFIVYCGTSSENDNNKIIETDLDNFSIDMAKNVYSNINNKNKYTIAVYPFSESDNETKLSKFLSEQIISGLVNLKSDNVTIITRDKLNKILEEQKISSSDYFDETKVASIGKQIGAEFIITGYINVLSDFVMITMQLIKVESGEIIFSPQSKLDKDENISLYMRESQFGNSDNRTQKLNIKRINIDDYNPIIENTNGEDKTISTNNMKVSYESSVEKDRIFKALFLEYAPKFWDIKLVQNSFNYDEDKETINLKLEIILNAKLIAEFLETLIQNGFTKKDKYLLASSTSLPELMADAELGIREEWNQIDTLLGICYPFKYKEKIYPTQDIYVSNSMMVWAFTGKKVKIDKSSNTSEENYVYTSVRGYLEYRKQLYIDYKENISKKYIINIRNDVSKYSNYFNKKETPNSRDKRKIEIYEIDNKGNRTNWSVFDSNETDIMYTCINNNNKMIIPIKIPRISKALATRITGIHLENIEQDLE